MSNILKTSENLSRCLSSLRMFKSSIYFLLYMFNLSPKILAETFSITEKAQLDDLRIYFAHFYTN